MSLASENKTLPLTEPVQSALSAPFRFCIAAEIVARLPPNTLLKRNEAALALSAIGYEISTATLETMASRGGGPAYRKFGRRALYKWSDLVTWAEGRCGAPACTTSEREG